MIDLYVCGDMGSSQTKILYQDAKASEPSYLLMPPHVEQVSAAALNRFFANRGWLGVTTPMQQAWITVDKQHFVVGAFAEEFDPADRLHELKYENALYKVLSIIGIIVQTLNLPTSQPLNVKLAVLLPWDEYSDRSRFLDRLQSMVSSFQFRKQVIQVKLQQLICRPEGGGLAELWREKMGAEWFDNQKIAVLMFGHRNTSALVSDNGSLKLGESPRYGFSVLLDQIMMMKSGLNRDILAAAIFSGMQSAQVKRSTHVFAKHPDWQKLDDIRSLATARDNALKEAEIADIIYAINVATADYWDKIKRWLDRILPKDLREVIVAGGAAPFLEPELEEYFNCSPHYNSLTNEFSYYTSRIPSQHQTDIIWGTNLGKEVDNLLKVKWRQNDIFTHRLVDAFGLFNFMLLKASEASQQAAAEAEARKKAQSEAKKAEAKKKAVAKKAQAKQAPNENPSPSVPAQAKQAPDENPSPSVPEPGKQSSSPVEVKENSNG